MFKHSWRLIFQWMGAKPWHAEEMSELLSNDPVDFSSEQLQQKLKQILIDFQYWNPERNLIDLQISASIQMKQKFCCILLGGTSGCGKSTLGALLASRMGISSVLSTDHLRQLLRHYHPKSEYPFLWTSSYQSGYREQNEMILPLLIELLLQYQKRHQSLIVEGVHLSPTIMQQLSKEVKVIPFLVYISNHQKHAERFAIRAKYMTLDKRVNKYIQYFENIVDIQEQLCQEADTLQMPKVDNTNVDKSLALIHQTVVSYLGQEKNDFERLNEIYNDNLQQYNGKRLLKQIQEKRKPSFDEATKEFLSSMDQEEPMGSLE